MTSIQRNFEEIKKKNNRCNFQLKKRNFSSSILQFFIQAINIVRIVLQIKISCNASLRPCTLHPSFTYFQKTQNVKREGKIVMEVYGIWPWIRKTSQNRDTTKLSQIRSSRLFRFNTDGRNSPHSRCSADNRLIYPFPLGLLLPF